MSKTRGRPTEIVNATPISLLIPRELPAQLDDIASDRDWSRSELIREVLDEFVLAQTPAE